MLSRLFWALVVVFMQTSEPDTIHLTVIDSTREEGKQGVGGVVISFSDDSDQLTGQCVTVAPTGICDIVLDAPEGFIRGSLTVGGEDRSGLFGKRSVIWPGGVVDVVIDVGLGSLHPNHPPHTTFDDATFTPTATVTSSATATLTPTPSSTMAVPTTAVTFAPIFSSTPSITIPITPTPFLPSSAVPSSSLLPFLCVGIAFLLLLVLVGLGLGWYWTQRRTK